VFPARTARRSLQIGQIWRFGSVCNAPWSDRPVPLRKVGQSHQTVVAMEADAENLIDQLDLFHFAVCLIGEDLTFMDLFIAGLAKLLRPRVLRHFSAFARSTLSEPSIVHTAEYGQLLSAICTQLRQIIDSIKKSDLWIAQGIAGTSQLSKLVNCHTYGPDQLRILHGVAVDQISFTAEIIIYYISLFQASVSGDQFTRLFAYSMIRSAPILYDPRHMIEVLRVVLDIWRVPEATFEFSAALALLLNGICDVIATILDDDLQEQLYQLFETIPNSRNFAMLMHFDPTLKWITKHLPVESLKRVLGGSLARITDGSYADICLVLKGVARGIFGFDAMLSVIELSLRAIREWSAPVKKETRSLLSALAFRLPPEVISSILTFLATSLKLQTDASDAIFVFADFVLVHYVRTTAPFHAGFYESLQALILAGKASADIQRMLAAICTNPVRFLRVAQQAKDRRLLESIKTFHSAHLSLYHILFDPKETPILTRNSLQTSLELSEISYISFCLRSALHPSIATGLVDSFLGSFDEDVKFKIAEVLLVIALTGREPTLIDQLRKKLFLPKHVCEYSSLLEQIDALTKPTPFSVLRQKMSFEVDVGTKALAELAILFQFVLWSEGKDLYIPFIRTRVHSPEWFMFVASSLFTTLFRDPIQVVEPVVVSFFGESKLYLVWFAIVMAKRMGPDWLDALADEQMDGFSKRVLYPQMEAGFDETEIELVRQLHAKYQGVFQEIQDVLAPAFPDPG
jgi:hypothetical protein